MQIRRLKNIHIALVSVILFGACSQKPIVVAPKFSGHLLLLAGENPNGLDLYELTAGPNSTYNYSVVTSGVFEAAASPDRTRLLYTTKDGIVLRDLRSGAVKPLAKGENSCLAWAPDANRFSYQQKSAGQASSKLFVSDLDGKTKIVWEDRTSGKSLGSNPAAGVSACAQWIAPDRLLFERFIGTAIEPKKGSAAIKPNTTTLAILGESVRLIDADRKWSIDRVCPVGSAAVVRPHDQDQPIMIAKNLDNLKTLNPAPLSCSGCRFVGFAAKSCVPFFIEDSSSTSSELFSLNPLNWQRQRGAHIGQTFSVNAKMVINSAARLMIVGDAPASLLLVDAESGEVVPFFPKSAANSELRNPIPVVWIEN